MIPAQFEYRVARSVLEAIDALQSRPDAKVLAGGQSLIPGLKARRITPSLLVDISRIPGLRGIAVSDHLVEIGPLTTHREIEDSEALRSVLPIMAGAADVLADPPVRSRGTFGGSLAYADPTGDWPAVAIALDARIEATGPSGKRIIPIDDFFVDSLQTALGSGELLTRVTLPIPPERTGMSYGKLRHPASGYAMVGIAAVVSTDENGVCQSCRVAVTGAGPRATLVRATCDALVGQRLTAGALRAAAAHATDGLPLSSDMYAGEKYRAHLVRVYVERVLRQATARVGG